MTISLQSVSRVFADSESGTEMVALQDIDLAIADNEFCALLGPSGCGKTTILNLVAGFDMPSSGRILVDGRPVMAPGPDRGVIFQSLSLFPWLSALDNLLFGPRVRGLDLKAERHRAQELIRMVGLEGFQHHLPHELSGGMQQRVAIARVLMNEPSVLLADEPFAALDEYTRRAMQEEFSRIWQRTRATVVFVTHNIEEAIFLADRIVVMGRKPGRIKAVLTIDMPRPRSRTSERVMELTRQALDLIQPEVAI
ncbi:MAG: ABC transporter ATP-binding protein [Pseudolabrys sp.]|nr:ABC transporter ATP-binding protein [Pseudolabrys sp.]